MTASSSLQQQQHVDKIQRTSSHPRGSTTTQQHESSSSSSSPPTTTSTSSSSSSSLSEMSQLATQMKSLQNSNTPLTTTELDNIMTSITNVLPSSDDHGIDLTALKNLLLESCHKSHKKWDETCQSATKLSNILLPDDDKPGLSSTFRTMMDRCLTEGNWEGAAAAATSRKSCENNDGNNKPWAVLVTGVNGIRKTTSVYQDWFPRLLSQALIEPSSSSSSKDDENENKNSTEEDQLPTGRNSFFRQLDHMIAILANVEFARLYELTSQSSSSSSSSSDEQQLPIDDYSRLKDAIFVRYRTLAEMMGIVLVEKARREKLNVMVETSGRDVAMFHYVDRFFPEGEYRKLALHFTIDDIGYAERSVDLRMEKEIRDGMAVLKKKSDDERNNVTDLINVNAGGPYGSDVLKGVQRDSDKVWEEEVMAGMVGDDWYKATISIRGNSKESATGVWTARAITKDGGEGEVFEFERR